MISSISHPASRSPTLESIKSEFSQWRATRVKGNRIPNSLWEGLKCVTTLHNYHQIASELKISPDRLCKKLGLSVQERPSSSRFSFAEVPIPESSVSPLQDGSLEQKVYAPIIKPTGCLEITRENGTILKVSGLSDESLLSLIQSLA